VQVGHPGRVCLDEAQVHPGVVVLVGVHGTQLLGELSQFGPETLVPATVLAHRVSPPTSGMAMARKNE